MSTYTVGSLGKKYPNSNNDILKLKIPLANFQMQRFWYLYFVLNCNHLANVQYWVSELESAPVTLVYWDANTEPDIVCHVKS